MFKCVCFQEEFNEAIIHYPELNGVRIVLRENIMYTLMAARPSFFSVFRRSDKRRYIISINTSRTNSNLKLNELDFNSRVGILGHELAHIADYHRMNSLQIILYGLRYMWSRKGIENRTDRSTIAHGLGIQLYHYASQCFNPSIAGKEYASYKIRNYLSPLKIMHLSRKLIENQF